jgi:hypothetical protein
MKAHVITQTNPNGSIESLRVFIKEFDAEQHYNSILQKDPKANVVWGKTEIDGFECYLESHYEITAAIERAEDRALEEDIDLFDGMGEKWIAAKRFTTEFELLNQSRDWDGEWLDEIDGFMSDKIKKQYENLGYK